MILLMHAMSPAGVTLIGLAGAILLSLMSSRISRWGAAIIFLVLASFWAWASQSAGWLSWTRSSCVSSRLGWSAFSLYNLDLDGLVADAAYYGDLRPMLYYSRNPIIPGLLCAADVRVRPPPGIQISGDFLPTCEINYRLRQGCVAEEFNRRLFRSGSGLKNCSLSKSEC